ncbi:hypothetical protein LCI18_001341 [Fusarium solani-melongenae]|uniref:Uncharacterized protein n=1 Tax=Fusarium solani subsp. cucurbitae TaxID=2747967 RepID=A0ACD3YNC9_FUSSC|nr:hypothetical protein LCI18_001341 [Fusarium solani-melongenae]
MPQVYDAPRHRLRNHSHEIGPSAWVGCEYQAMDNRVPYVPRYFRRRAPALKIETCPLSHQNLPLVSRRVPTPSASKLSSSPLRTTAPSLSNQTSWTPPGLSRVCTAGGCHAVRQAGRRWGQYKNPSPPSDKRCPLFILFLFIFSTLDPSTQTRSSFLFSLFHFFQAHALPFTLALAGSSLRLWNVHVALGLAPSSRAVAHQLPRPDKASFDASPPSLTLCQPVTVPLYRLKSPTVFVNSHCHHIKLFVMSSYNYEYDDDYNGPGCCMKCCRALDIGNHDACGACYCRRSFRPDYDRDIYPNWSFGEYYPGSRVEDWAGTSSNAAPITDNSNNRGGRGTSSRNTSDSTSHSTRQGTAASETRQSPKNGGDSKDSDKSGEKKAKPKSFCEHSGKN